MGFLWRIDPGTPLERPHRRDAFNLAFASVLQAASPTFALVGSQICPTCEAFAACDTFAGATVVARVLKIRAAVIGARVAE